MGSIPSKLVELKSLTPLILGTIHGCICLLLLHRLSRWLTFPCHSILSADCQLMGSIVTELGELTLLNFWSLSMWIGLSCWHDCHGFSHSLAILFEQVVIHWFGYVDKFVMLA